MGLLMGLLEHRDTTPLHPDTKVPLEFHDLVTMVTRRQVPPYEDTSGQSVAAYVNQGRWVADCPHGDGGALVIDIHVLRFICPRCANWRVDGKWHEVILPEDFHEIERLLELRPDLMTRNWRSPESVADLLQENLDHELPA